MIFAFPRKNLVTKFPVLSRGSGQSEEQGIAGMQEKRDGGSREATGYTVRILS